MVDSERSIYCVCEKCQQWLKSQPHPDLVRKLLYIPCQNQKGEFARYKFGDSTKILNEPMDVQIHYNNSTLGN
jgi:hypothetical protein